MNGEEMEEAEDEAESGESSSSDHMMSFGDSFKLAQSGNKYILRFL